MQVDALETYRLAATGYHVVSGIQAQRRSLTANKLPGPPLRRSLPLRNVNDRRMRRGRRQTDAPKAQSHENTKAGETTTREGVPGSARNEVNPVYYGRNRNQVERYRGC
jgi:hypothetical protein